MPQVKVAIWNVETFGQNPGDLRGTNSAHLAEFIRGVVRTQDIDVLVILEAMSTCRMALTTLVNALNRGRAAGDAVWRSDLIKGALARNANHPPTGPGDLSFNGGLRHEGYALLWREDPPQPAAPLPFSMVQPVLPISDAPEGVHALDLVLEGRDMVAQRANNRLVSLISGYDPAGAFPLNPVYNGESEPWGELDFIPSSGVYDQSISGTRTLCRRPCTFAIRLNVAAGPVTVPVVAFHSPVQDYKREASTYRCSLSKQLYVMPVLNGLAPTNVLEVAQYALAGGDFNVQADSFDGVPIFGGFTRAFSDNDAEIEDWGNLEDEDVGGAGMETDLQADEGTVVVPDEPEAGTSAQSTDYLTLPIDRGFYRVPAGAPVTAAVERLDLVQLVYNNGPADLQAGVRAYDAGLQAKVQTAQNRGMRGGIDGQHGPYDQHLDRDFNWQRTYVYRWSKRGTPNIELNRWGPFHRGIAAGHFSAAGAGTAAQKMRAAAEFLRILVSDHLPLVFTLNW